MEGVILLPMQLDGEREQEMVSASVFLTVSVVHLLLIKITIITQTLLSMTSFCMGPQSRQEGARYLTSFIYNLDKKGCLA